MKEKLSKNQRKLLIIFLIGIFVGGMDGAIINPARSVIAENLSLSANASIWMITIYTLFYSMSIPIMGKLADLFGKKRIFIIAITIFGIGSLMAGLSNLLALTELSSHAIYQYLLLMRVIQAIGAGAILPIAVGYISTSFPVEKRGAMLGLVGTMYGLANIFGPTIGSFILGVFGTSSWGMIFFINVPIIIGMLLVLIPLEVEQHVATKEIKIDYKGSVLITMIIGMLMYFLINFDFTAPVSNFININQAVFFWIPVILMPLFIFVENRAYDPIIEVSFFKNRDFTLIIILTFLVGMTIMTGIFLPQLGENVMHLPAGSGGYLLTFMAFFSATASIYGGRGIDKYGPKKIMIIGITANIIGMGLIAFVVTQTNSVLALFASLMFIGIGNGMTIGAPPNYLMQERVAVEHITISQSLVTLFRSIGATIAPAFLINIYVQNIKATANATFAPHINPYLSAIQPGSIDNLSTIINSNVTTIVANINVILASTGTNKYSVFVSEYVNNNSTLIESKFQSTLNSGYSAVFITFIGIDILILLTILAISNKHIGDNKI